MKHRSMALAAATIAGSSLLLAGCGAAATKTGTTGPKSPVGNVAIVGLAPQTSPNWWFPITANTAYSDLNGTMQDNLYLPLLHISRTDGIDYARSLASDVTWNSSGTVYTITLHKKWKWSNGTSVTAADVVWSMKLLEYLSGGKAPWTYGGAGIGGLPAMWKSVVAQGNHTVVVTLNQKANPQWFLHNGLGQVQPVPKSVWDIHPNNMANEANFIKSVSNTPSSSYYNVVDGPFKYDAKASKPNNQYWTFVPNPKYDGHKASISKLIYQYETNSASEFAALKTGKINVGFLPPSLWNSKSELTNDKFSTLYVFGFNYMVPNFSPKAPGNFAKLIAPTYVRQALEMGINQPGMISSLYHGHGTQEWGPIPPKPKTVFDDPNIQNIGAYNWSAGKQLLLSHGWHLVNGVMTNPQGIPFKFTFDYVSGSNSVKAQAELMAQDWAKMGIQVTLLSQPFNTLIGDNTQAGVTNWQMIWWGGGWTYEPDYYPTGGGLFKTGAGSNAGGYTSKQMDTLINKTYSPGTASQITSNMNAYQAYAAAHYPVIWLPWIPGFNENANYISGVTKWANPITDQNSPNRWVIK